MQSKTKLFPFSGYCSCPPFECICTYQQPLSASLHQFPPSPSTYQQPQLDSFWAQEPTPGQSYPTEIGTNLNQQYDFNSISTDLFQPEEIFQMDQPVKPDYVHVSQNNEVARSPPTLLDLGSGTIHREFKSEDYWNPNISNMLINDDSNNSSNSNSRYNLSQSPENQLALNNNSQPVDQNFYMESKIDELPFPLQKSHYYQQNTSFDLMDNKTSYLMEDKGYQNFETYPNTKIYNKHNYQEEYIDLGQFNEYNSFLSVYDNKTTNDSTMFNDLDFRINSCVPSLSNVHNYSHEAFDVISHQ